MGQLSLSNRWAKEIRQYEPIDMDGFRLYPIRVADYPLFLVAKPAIEFVVQTLDFKYMSLPLLQAFFEMDMDYLQEGKKPTGLLSSAVMAIGLALRLVQDSNVEEMLNRFEFVLNPENPNQLKHIIVEMPDGEKKMITPALFGKMRPIIAAQNGVELISEDANVELLEAERDLAEKNAPNLKVDIGSMIQAACVLCHVNEEEVNEWAILKMNNRLDSFKRILDYAICSIGATQGTTWKGGNPAPSPWFERQKESSGALISMDTFAGGQGLKAMQDSVSGEDS